MSSLNQYGGACRCLLRVREDQGKDCLSDEAFISQHLEAFPQWKTRPGELNGTMLERLAVELGVASSISDCGSFSEILQQHQSGRQILVRLAAETSPREICHSTIELTMLLVRMDAASFTLWCPYQSGASGLMPALSRDEWERRRAHGLVLHLELNPSCLS